MENPEKVGKYNRLDKFLVSSGIAAPIALFIAILIAGILHPHYSHLSQAISELGATGAPNKEILNYGGLMLSGLLTFVFSLAMFRHLSHHPALYLSSTLVAIAGIGRFLAGIYHCDPGCTPLLTQYGRLHAMFGMISLLTGAIAPVVMALALRKKPSSRLFQFSLGLGLVSALAFILLVSGTFQSYFGAIQRLLLVLTYSWIIFVSTNFRPTRP
jgi:hypothetical membrane protein